MTDDFAPATRFRNLRGPSGKLLRMLLFALVLAGASWSLEIQNSFPLAIFKEQYLGLFLALALTSIFLGIKAHAGEPDGAVPWYDCLLAAAGLIVGGYVAAFYPTIAYRLGVISLGRWLLGGVAVLLILEATRRLVGWALVVLAGCFILYAKFAFLFPGVFYAKGSSWERIATYLYLDSSGVLGFPLNVAATIVVAFIVFGRALYAVGGDKFLTDLALTGMGRFRGGPAKVAVVSSSLFGTVSGSAVSNVVVDGAITIPMMKRTGYPSHLAAAIEAVASTGGQIMPPVMGVAAFLIAEFLNIPYREVALAAIFPACLYYVALFTQVDLEAAKYGLAGLPAGELPRFRSVIRGGWVFLVPLLVLIYTLMIDNWQAGKAGMAAVIATFACGILQKTTRPSSRQVIECIEESGRTLLDIVAISAAAGLVIGALQLSGLSFKLSLILVTISGGNSLFLLSLTGLVCILLGMGMPTAIIYIMLAVLVGPALVQIRIEPLAAHLFILYFGMLSMITPPVCLASYAAASLARSSFWATGWAGARLGIVAYVVPFVFVYHPALILKGTAGAIVLALCSAVVGVIMLAVGCAGYLFRPMGWEKRVLMCMAGLFLIPPPSSVVWIMTNLTGLAAGAFFVAWEWNGAKLGRAVAYPDRRGI